MQAGNGYLLNGFSPAIMKLLADSFCPARDRYDNHRAAAAPPGSGARADRSAGEPYCPRCGCVAVYSYASRPIFKCKGWDRLHAKFDTRRINHSEAYSHDGACTNMAESFFSRLRRAEIGTHHHIAGPYLNAYANEMAWREDQRRQSNGSQFTMMVAAAMAHPVSRQWKGYWQR